MRLFFALLPDPETALAVDDWRSRYLRLPPPARAISLRNLHITLRFCGEVNEQQSKQLVAKARNIKASQISVSLDVSGYFGNTRIAWIGPECTPPDILYLHQRLGAAKERGYQPHLTLYRGLEAPPPPPLMPPAFQFRCASFELMISTRGRTGVHYDVLESFPLN
ncbi:MAG: RNA 2',3'-cyclic phosphodiesterase [Pseudomonadota bacterium]